LEREREASRRIAALSKENSDLRAELGAFDLEFFEELEDLKWRYQQAAIKCRAFDDWLRERGEGPYQGGDGDGSGRGTRGGPGGRNQNGSGAGAGEGKEHE